MGRCSAFSQHWDICDEDQQHPTTPALPDSRQHRPILSSLNWHLIESQFTYIKAAELLCFCDAAHCDTREPEAPGLLLPHLLTPSLSPPLSAFTP